MQENAYNTNQENQEISLEKAIANLEDATTPAELTTTLKTVRKLNKHAWAIILAGGRGSRLPIAGSIPKQFAPKFEGVTFIQDIVKAISLAINPSHQIIVVTNPEQKELAIKQLTPLGVPSTN